MERESKIIVDFIKTWRSSNGISDEVRLSGDQIFTFISELHTKITQMDFSVPDGTTVIAYTGWSNGNPAWRIAAQTSQMAGVDALYISDLPAGKLIGIDRDALVAALENIVGDDKNCIEKIISGGYTEDGNWIRMEGGKCGFGDFLSIDDLVSAKLMGETVGASNNLVMFAPEGIDPSKVFGTTELKQIFQNDTFEYINGIPKEELRILYESGEVGVQSVYDVLIKTSKEVVGDVSAIDDQTKCLEYRT